LGMDPSHVDRADVFELPLRTSSIPPKPHHKATQTSSFLYVSVVECIHRAYISLPRDHQCVVFSFQLQWSSLRP
jgi:hypothetical protein